MLKTYQPEKFVTEVNAFEIRDWVQENVQAGVSHLLIDFQNVGFINSSGLGALATALKMAREADARLALSSLNPQARMTLEIAGMDKAFEIFEDPAAYESVISAPSTAG